MDQLKVELNNAKIFAKRRLSSELWYEIKDKFKSASSMVSKANEEPALISEKYGWIYWHHQTKA